ncbi:MAG: CoA pyrophosphatase [Desulforhopalus sp.]|jgi:8-oxo-dGTP pyrophosphatase MutT (NUDIX family)|nr:CoA pyrophosphatase [Desulforhopalus sp.]
MDTAPPSPPGAAVAIIRSFEPRDSFLILRRTAHPTDPWSGHFSFPGGRKEKSDPNLLATCLRETAEETGIVLQPEDLQQILEAKPAGRESPSPLWVQPFLFTLYQRPPLQLNPREIRHGYWLQVDHFLDSSRHLEVELLPGKIFPAFPLDDYYLWGFTYRLLLAILFPRSG